MLNLLIVNDLINDDEFFFRRRPRTFRERINFLEIERPLSTFIEDFRVDQSVVDELLGKIGPLLQHKTKRNKALSPEQRLLTTLHWMGHGSQYHVNGRAHGVHKSTVCRNVHNVSHLINEHFFHDYVRWPDDVSLIARDFENIAGFPDIVGLIDGTLVRIEAPTADEPAYVDRNNNHSVNLTLVGGPKHEFFFASCKCPGSVQDSRALRVSNLWKRWEIDGSVSNNDFNTNSS